MPRWKSALTVTILSFKQCIVLRVQYLYEFKSEGGSLIQRFTILPPPPPWRHTENVSKKTTKLLYSIGKTWQWKYHQQQDITHRGESFFVQVSRLKRVKWKNVTERKERYSSLQLTRLKHLWGTRAGQEWTVQVTQGQYLDWGYTERTVLVPCNF